jgi:hypothetical protein
MIIRTNKIISNKVQIALAITGTSNNDSIKTKTDVEKLTLYVQALAELCQQNSQPGKEFIGRYMHRFG